ncbi:RelA/SpoT family protein [Aphanothece sacrum]|uniref:(P)ppGpp synthetase I, SpoT/RelA n=1 Tax=Aphanothece sacrum FPU1 TaxID=1920663 RepID=A0A401IK00_APHSA|nr:bifunctional (p)ppGpp synthetase/guanosine-3',5'-bis(diphosphate) 3'-pyrophosphohydrolase [Aphanothece sacrum]GBF81607.1 (p)ppGpp synthetase I, SpoT/RelA [Aphanothece sacrum FPU1]GBF84135.1 (p)ppGpp synthetase I, SpoT/RelA [Aphanothece sacrum FPU3]
MNTVTLPDLKSAEPYELILPDWLNQCLITYQTNGSNDDLNLICRAFNFANQLHEGQYRKSGEPYIAHPVAVAGLLRDLGGDKAMIAAGFLHDVVEDTEITLEDIEKQFGEEVRHLVEGVTKLSKLNFSSTTEQQAENFRRMFLAMAKDIRVIVVKLADRLHNMRTLDALRPDKQRRIALETREIFAPLANRLGIWRLKWELEDLSFKYLETDAYRDIQSLVAEKRIDRETRIESVKSLLLQRLQEIGVKVLELQGRPKHLYGIYQKMERQQKGFHEIYDIAAVRIIVENNEECYRALAVVHDEFKPIPGRFKDYIGLPKPNRYQSLHTSVVGTTGRPIEVQIRTLEMHHIAEYGIAAHWKYKETGGSHQTKLSQDDEKFTWLRQLLEWQNDLKDAQEYVDNLKDNLFDDDVYVFTPHGDVVALARGATAVDFAYRIHTEVGNHMKGARINGKWSVVDASLNNGDMVEIITQKNAHPSLDWLNFVVTPSARNRIRQWYKRSRREENVARGRDMLEKELGKSGLDALLKSERMQTVTERCNYQAVDDLLAALGYGEITLNQIVNRLRETMVKGQQQSISAITLPTASPSPACPTKPNVSPILGVEGLVYHIAGCCHPLPGESIIGVVTRGARGISIHCQGCCNVDQIPGDRLIPVRWNTLDSNCHTPTYPVDLQIEAIDRLGVLRDILSRLMDLNINVRNAGVKTGRNKPARISLRIDIRDRQQLECLIGQIRNMSDILNIHRVHDVDNG